MRPIMSEVKVFCSKAKENYTIFSVQVWFNEICIETEMTAKDISKLTNLNIVTFVD